MYNMHGSERVNRQSDVDGFVRQVPFLGASRSPFYEPKILVEERCQLCHGVKVNKVSSVIKNCSKLALLGSYTIWNARYSQDWSGGGFLKP